MTSASELLARLANLLRNERAAMADFLVALADFDRGRVWLKLGYPSLFHFLHRELGLAKGPAYYRKTAAVLIQRFPEIVEPLRDGRLCLTSIVELAKVITPENRDEVLPRFFHLSKQEAKAVSAEIQPDAAVPVRQMVTTVRLPVRPPALALAPAAAQRDSTAHPPLSGEERNETVSQSVLPEELERTLSWSADAAGAAATSLPASPRPRALSAEPLTAELNRLHLTVSKRFLRKLEAARAALSPARAQTRSSRRASTSSSSATRSARGSSRSRGVSQGPQSPTMSPRT